MQLKKQKTDTSIEDTKTDRRREETDQKDLGGENQGGQTLKQVSTVLLSSQIMFSLMCFVIADQLAWKEISERDEDNCMSAINVHNG